MDWVNAARLPELPQYRKLFEREGNGISPEATPVEVNPIAESTPTPTTGASMTVPVIPSAATMSFACNRSPVGDFWGSFPVDLLMLDLDDNQDSLTGHVVDKRSVGDRIASVLIYKCLF